MPITAERVMLNGLNTAALFELPHRIASLLFFDKKTLTLWGKNSVGFFGSCKFEIVDAVDVTVHETDNWDYDAHKELTVKVEQKNFTPSGPAPMVRAKWYSSFEGKSYSENPPLNINKIESVFTYTDGEWYEELVNSDKYTI